MATLRYKIVHETAYTFNSEVFLEPHTLRFKPKATPFITLDSFSLNIFPKPTGVTEQLDAENNLICTSWFEGMHSQLTLKSEAVVTVEERNPLDFILYPASYLIFPFLYDGSLKSILEPSLKGAGVGQSLLDYGRHIAQAVKFATVEFIIELTRQMHKDFVVEYRAEGIPLDPDDTFNSKRGSCRDLAWMQIQLLREMGIASRFVSGYFYIPDSKGSAELHGWVEAYLPGAGWVGFDPSHGILTGNAHIVVASSSHYENTMPVLGKIRGSATSRMQTSLAVHTIEI